MAFPPPRSCPENLRCEEYWSKDSQPSILIWWKISEWLRKAYCVERFLCDTEQFTNFREITPSRLVRN